MDRKLATLVLLVYSLSNLFAFCGIAYPNLSGGCLIILLIGGALIALIGYLNYIKLVKEEYYSLNHRRIGFAPSYFFGTCYILGIMSGCYLAM